jgi:addiction module HigA family antidote
MVMVAMHDSASDCQTFTKSLITTTSARQPYAATAPGAILGELHHQEDAMGAATGIRMKNPAHPGGFVKHEIIEPHSLSVTDAARILGVTRPALSALLNEERTTLSPEMALRLEAAFGVSMDTLMRMQNSYDIAQARKMEGEIDVARFSGNPQPTLA